MRRMLGAAIHAHEAVGQRRYILAPGRRLPCMYVISLDAALDPANLRTSKAIVGRSKVAAEALDGRVLGDPANLVVSERGDPRAEIGRVPTQVGPWGITATPDRWHIIVANGGSQRDGSAGNTISVIDLDRASRLRQGFGAQGAGHAEVARVLVGTDDPLEQSHPLIPSVTPDGRYAVLSAGPSVPPFSPELGHIYVIDLRSRRVVATVTGVGHEPYALAVVERQQEES